MTLYDEYRRDNPVASEPSEFRDIVEAEVKRVIEWMESRKPLPAEEIKPGRYRMIDTMGTLVDVVQGSRGLWVMAIEAVWNLPIEWFCHRGIVFQVVEEGI